MKCKDNSYYTGITNNIEKRIESHKSGKGAKYTKNKGPFRLVYKEECNNQSSALKREIAIKKLKRIEKNILIEKN